MSNRGISWVLILLLSATVAAYAAPETSPLSALTVPRDVSDADVQLSVKVSPDSTDHVRFDLMTYTGNVLWSKKAPVKEGTASAILPAKEIAGAPKGEYVVAAIGGGHRLCVALCLRGKTFHNVRTAPAEMKPGDEIIITDLSCLEPKAAFSEKSAKGLWWLRGYTAGDGVPRALACVEERDMAQPESCLAPPIRLPLDLKGWYEIWVRTYRHDVNGGIDVRLSGEKYFVHADPNQISTIKDAPVPPKGSLVELRYRAADLTGQDLIFQQPYGTYESQHLLANASLAGVRLVKLSEEQVGRIERERARKDVRIIGYDNDGFSYFWRWGVKDPACIARLLEPLRDQSTDFLNVSLGGLGGLIVPTPYTGMYQMTGHTRHGDYRANDFFRWCFEEEVNIIDVLAERAHETGLRLFVALMMERSFSRDAFMKAHPELMIKKGPGTWNYALPEVHDYQVKKIAWIMENHDIDGFTVDFTRYGHYFNTDEPNKFEHMNAFLRKLRAATDAINAKKTRKVLLNVSFADESRFIRHWGTGKLTDQGLDVKTWLDEGLFDFMMPEGPTALDFVAMAKGTKTQVWPRKAAGYPFACDKRLGGNMSPIEITRGAREYLDAGAQGIFFFNHDSWNTFGRLGFKEELALRAAVDVPYGLREMGPIAFTGWYPSITERDAQRKALKPATIACNRDGDVSGDLLIALPNTFNQPVAAKVTWAASEGLDKPWTAAPATQTLDLPAKGRARAAVHVAGQVPDAEDALAADVVLSSNGQTMFRHRLPVRAVPYLKCQAVADAAAMDALTGQTLAAVEGNQDAKKEKATFTAAYDKENLYMRFSCSGMDMAAIPRDPQKRDSRSMAAADNVQVLIDTDGSEEAFHSLTATPAGGQLDAFWRFEPFIGHHRANYKWNGEWTAKTTWTENGYKTLVAIPFKTLGQTPKSGDQWRINTIACIVSGQAHPAVFAWSSPDKAHTLPAGFGVLVFE